MQDSESVIQDVPQSKCAWQLFLGELFGTMLLVTLGCQVMCHAKTGAFSGVFQIAMCWGLAVSISVYCVSGVCDAHLNPAVTLAFAIVRGAVTWVEALWCVAGQLVGAVAGGCLTFATSEYMLTAYEQKLQIERGSTKSILTAMTFGMYFPNPEFNKAYIQDQILTDSDVSFGKAFMMELILTMILVMVIFSITHPRNHTLGKDESERSGAPMIIGLTIVILICIHGATTMVGMNPARDLGPRFVAALAGWGSIAMPGPRNEVIVYGLAPLIGGPLGAWLVDRVLWKDPSPPETDPGLGPRKRDSVFSAIRALI